MNRGFGFVLSRTKDTEPEQRIEHEKDATEERSKSSRGNSNRLKAPEYVTDDVRILQFLVSNGKKMYQEEIIESTGWSKSKVSRVLSELEAENVITKTQVGRKNIITITGVKLHDPY
ncbi:helix-turn-helix transcriptional regulator [Haladaptatus sp. DFWS20]|uniref:helix-turn-helix transcriptional regulator n=1 Tax=Haladaptatus sp. DFWS20 TaxID=3403467 RepID=UPI003EBFEF69